MPLSTYIYYTSLGTLHNNVGSPDRRTPHYVQTHSARYYPAELDWDCGTFYEHEYETTMHERYLAMVNEEDDEDLFR